MSTYIHHITEDDLYKLMRVAVPECAGFEFVGDNPYCPAHGKPLPKPTGTQVIVSKSFAERWTTEPQHYKDYFHTDNIQFD